MREYELVREIKNSCPNNQMRDVFFEEIECDDPVAWLQERLKEKNVGLSVEYGGTGTVTIHAVVDGMIEKFLFTPI